jgi:hypothetical protein
MLLKQPVETALLFGSLLLDIKLKLCFCRTFIADADLLIIGHNIDNPSPLF